MPLTNLSSHTMRLARFRAYRQQKQFKRLKGAANTISTFAKGWFVRRKVAQERGRVAQDDRFAGVMDRHREHMQALEDERRLIQRTAAVDLDDLLVRRNRSAAVVQAHWRGWVQRKQHASSPERLGRQKAALQIQAAFKKHMHSRRATGDPNSSQPFLPLGQHHQHAGTTHSTPVGHRHPSSHHPTTAHHTAQHGGDQDASGFSSPASSPTASFQGFARRPPSSAAAASLTGDGRSLVHSSGAAMRDSHASVLLGSPGAPVPHGGVGGRAGGEMLLQRGPGVMSNKRYADLEKQVNGRIEAYKALSRTRHKEPRSLEDALAPLLHAHTSNAQARLHATAPRQQALKLSAVLFETLGHVAPLSQLPPGAAPSDYPRPAQGSSRALSAGGAHALMLAEARVGARWWGPLKAMNRAALQEARLAEEGERFDAMDAGWRRRWAALSAAEERRPDPMVEFEEGLGAGSRAVAAAAVERRREADVQHQQQQVVGL
ncbi:MAG: hypothetical protein WDW38_002006 [Sanguina aurantia]